MSESCREHRPLLCEEVSDEELHQFHLQQRRYVGYRGKANNTIKGATAIIKKWPDHVSSSVTYWWAGFGMFVLLVFITYNTAIYAMIPEGYSKLAGHHNATGKNVQPIHRHSLPDVFIHVIANTEKEADFEKYLPYIKIISNANLQYNFNLIVLFNDTSQDQSNHQAKLNNEDALNSLWSANKMNEINTTPNKKEQNIKMQYMNLSSYLNDSPLQKFWKHLPSQFIEFMVRAVAIWNKGGIVFNPVILTPRSPHAVYIEKLQNILQTYQQLPKIKVTQNTEQYTQNTQQKKNSNGLKHKNRKKVNNIRDIIDALETDTTSQSQIETLSEAENRQEFSKMEIKPLFNGLLDISDDEDLSVTDSKTLHDKLLKNKEMKPLLNGLMDISDDEDVMSVTDSKTFHDKLLKNKEMKPIQVNAKIIDLQKHATTDKSIFLPLFLDFLFRSKSEILMHGAKPEHVSKRSSKPVSTDATFEDLKDNMIQPMIIPSPTENIVKPKTEENFTTPYEDEDKLTIDLKGNILSTRTPCHAFIGSVFNHVKYCNKGEPLKDFIISELLQFCKESLSTCKGIDVILV